MSNLLAVQHDALTRLDHWIAAGWMRPLERALLALLIERGGEQDAQVLLLAALASQQLGQGDICVDLARAVAAPASLFPFPGDHSAGDSPLRWLQQQTLAGLRDALHASAVVEDASHDAQQAPLVLDGNLLYLRRYFRYEIDVAEQIRQRLAVPVTAPAQLPQRLAALFPAASARPDWQKIACALATRSALTLITGGPGTGKTTTVVRLLGLLQSVAMEQGAPLRIRLAAPTGKAAARLSASISGAIAALPLAPAVTAQIPATVSTLHKLLGSHPDSRRFRHHRHQPLHADLVVVDEASMMDLELTASLLDALRADTRLILIGDKDQLASVEAGAVLGNLCVGAEQGHYLPDTVAWLAEQAGEDVSPWAAPATAHPQPLAQQTVMLRHSHRFAADSGIGQLARAVNQGDQEALRQLWQQPPADISRLTLTSADDPALATLCVAGYRHYLTQLQTLRPADSSGIEAWAAAVLEAFADFQLLCAVREGDTGVTGVNRRIARALQRAGLISRAEGWYEGRPVMLTRNDYQLGLMNGDVGIALNLGTAADPDTPELAAAPDRGDTPSGTQLRVVFRLADGRISRVLPSRLDGAESVYAMTVHKSQGSEFRHAALLLPDGGPGVSRELLYTAITRARAQFTLAGSAAALARPAQPTERAAGLARRLHGNQP